MRATVITGASSGLGIEFARIHASKGDNLVLIARSEDAMKQLKNELETQYGVSVHILVKDLSQANAVSEIEDDLKRIKIEPEILINNAGFGDFGSFAQCDWTKQQEMIQVNIVALTALSRIVLPGMLARKNGKIMNVASTAAFQPGPGMSVYFATKAFVLSLSEALSWETKNTGVTVTALCPGPTATGFKNKASLDKSGLFASKHIATAREVAIFGHRAMTKGKSVAIHGFFNLLGARIGGLLPRSIVNATTQAILREK